MTGIQFSSIPLLWAVTVVPISAVGACAVHFHLPTLVAAVPSPAHLPPSFAASAMRTTFACRYLSAHAAPPMRALYAPHLLPALPLPAIPSGDTIGGCNLPPSATYRYAIPPHLPHFVACCCTTPPSTAGAFGSQFWLVLIQVLFGPVDLDLLDLPAAPRTPRQFCIGISPSPRAYGGATLPSTHSRRFSWRRSHPPAH